MIINKVAQTLYKQLGWNRFLQVLQGVVGNFRSETLIILRNVNFEMWIVSMENDSRIADSAFSLTLEVQRHVLAKYLYALFYLAVLNDLRLE